MTSMAFPESLRKDFDVLESHPSGRILAGYHVRERKHGGREFMLRLLPDSFCRDKDLVESFHEFFTRFASISNKSYTPQVYSVTGAVNGPVYVLEEYVSGISLILLRQIAKIKHLKSTFVSNTGRFDAGHQAERIPASILFAVLSIFRKSGQDIADASIIPGSLDLSGKTGRCRFHSLVPPSPLN